MREDDRVLVVDAGATPAPGMAAEAAPGCGCDPEYAGGIRRQFGHPRGLLGWLVGRLMAVKNQGRSRRVLDLLEIEPKHHVLEIGFGPGVDVRRASSLARHGRVAGVDHSAVMVSQARRRNAGLVRQGRVDLRLASAEALPFGDGVFDRAFSINAIQFWSDPAAGARELARVLRPGGVGAIAIQPRSPGATAATTRAWGWRIESLLRDAGFVDIRRETHESRPVPTVCVLGTR
jgi:SAM-dependent methyltransferase